MHLRPNFPIVVSGYTVSSHLGDYYKKATYRLTKSLIKHDLPHIIYPLEPTKNWTAGCAMKPSLILNTLKAFNHPVLWIDADGEVLQYPKVFENAKFNVGLVKVGGHWLSGTLYFSPKAINLAQKWNEITKPSEPDEITLLNLCRNNPKFMSQVRCLDRSYNQIIHTETDVSKIVIGHYIRPDVAGSRGVKAVEL